MNECKYIFFLYKYIDLYYYYFTYKQNIKIQESSNLFQLFTILLLTKSFNVNLKISVPYS
jgi:hypothetical protein